MKQKLKRGVRKFLPKRAADNVEKMYRTSRSRMISAKYGNPANDVKVIVVAGSNGKATTARFLNEMLQEIGRKTMLILNDDNAVGAESINRHIREAKKQSVDYVILSVAYEDIRRHTLSGVAIEAAIVTNSFDAKKVTQQDAVRLLEQVLYLKPRYIVLNHDDPSIEVLSSYPATSQKITYGFDEQAEAHCSEVKLYKLGSEAKVVIDHQITINLATYLVGTANIYNAVAAAAAIYVMGEPIRKLDEGAARLESSDGNYQYVEVDASYSVAIDSAPNDAAMLSVLESAKQIAKRRLIMAVDASQISADTIELLGKGTARLILVGGEEYAKGSIESVATVEEVIQKIARSARKDDVVLLAGRCFTADASETDAMLHAIITNTKQDS